MTNGGSFSDVIAKVLSKLGGTRHGNRHLSDREWLLLEAPPAPKRRLNGEWSQWTEDNLD